MASQGLKIAIQIVLGLVIIALGYWLYLSITEPWDAVERQREVTRMTRAQMDKVRIGLIRHEREEDRFPGTLDSLMLWIRQDSLIQADPDTIFGAGINLDSLIYSPRTGNKFMYALNDTGRVKIYLLKDPDSEDQIGSETPDVTQLNAASWE
jgi:hypothetical protein